MIKRILRSKNSQNSFWNIFEVLVSPLILFVSIPLFLAQLGSEDYGIWMFVNTIVILLQSLNLGLNTSTYKHVSSALSTKDETQINQTLTTNLSLTMLLSVVGFLIIGIVAFFIVRFNFFIDASVQKSTLVFSLFLGGFILFSKLTEQAIFNTLLLFVPSFLGCGIAYFDQWIVKLLFLAATIISAYLLFIKKPKTTFNAFVQ